jgi:hypothetical protein
MSQKARNEEGMKTLPKNEFEALRDSHTFELLLLRHCNSPWLPAGALVFGKGDPDET